MITVLGGSGFIGRRLTKRLEELKLEHFVPGRDEGLTGKHLGHVIYCIGLTADFRSRPFDTVEAHVTKLADVLRTGTFDSLLYLSSTRLYDESQPCTVEDTPLRVAPVDPDNLYNLSKAMGESLALNSGLQTRVARISNVYGDDFTSANFLSTILREAVSNKSLVLERSPASAKDYLSVDDVVDGLLAIATRGRERIYNLASGENVSNGQLAESLSMLTSCAIEFVPQAPTVISPPINIERMQLEFDFKAKRLLDNLPKLVELYRENSRNLKN